VDPQGRVQGANRAAARMLGQPVPQLLGLRLADLLDLAPRRTGPCGQAAAELRTAHGLTLQAQLDAGHAHRPTHLPAGPPSLPADPSAGTLRQLEVATIRQTLADLGGNVSEAARRLGVSRNTIYRRLAAPPEPLT
jgi:transcriptional regulator of acetoin/glycerol metabolism